MDPSFRSVFQRFPGAIDVLFPRPCQTADHRTLDLGADPFDGLEIAGRTDGEPRLDDVHPEPGELLRQSDLFLNVHAGSRGLLAVTERGIEYFDDLVHTGFLNTLWSQVPLEPTK